MNLQPRYARIGISAHTRIVFSSVLFFFTGLIIFTQLSVFTQPASAISFTTSSVRPADVLNYEALGYTYDTLSRFYALKSGKRTERVSWIAARGARLPDCAHDLCRGLQSGLVRGVVRTVAVTTATTPAMSSSLTMPVFTTPKPSTKP